MSQTLGAGQFAPSLDEFPGPWVVEFFDFFDQPPYFEVHADNGAVVASFFHDAEQLARLFAETPDRLARLAHLTDEQQREFLVDVALAATEPRTANALASLAEVHEQWAKFAAEKAVNS